MLECGAEKYSNYDRKLLAAFLACKKFKHFLNGREFKLKTDHRSLIPSLLREKTSNSDQKQRQLSYLAEMTADFEYIAGPLNAAADALSSPPAEDEEEEVCAILPADSPRHWDEKELLAAQEEDHLTLAAAERLASTPDFSWAEKRGGPLRLLRKAKAPNVVARAILLLPPAYRQAAIKALHEDTRAGQQQTIKMARDRYIWPGLG